MAKAKAAPKIKTPAKAKAQPVTEEAKASHEKVVEKAFIEELKKQRKAIEGLAGVLTKMQDNIENLTELVDKQKHSCRVERERLRRLHMRSGMAYEGKIDIP